MDRIPLTGGTYQAPSLIANAQSCINLFPERNSEEDEAPAPVTHYLTPGLKLAVQGEVAPVRGLWLGDDNKLYGVIGLSVYYIDENFGLNLLGSIQVDRPTPVSITDNGVALAIVDGSGLGYSVDLATHAFTLINDLDTTGAFVGADKVDYIDTFLVFNKPNSPSFYSTLSGVIQFDPLDVAQKTGSPDNIQTIAVVHDEIWLLGAIRGSEVWNNAGNPTFPFARIPGVFIQHGCVAKYSVAVEDLSVFWLSRNNEGQAIAMRGSNYQCLRISTHALEKIWQGYGKIDDAIGYCYQIQGHVFYVLTFVAANATWVFDDATKLWHQWGSLDANGFLGRHRSNCHAFAYGQHIVGDYQNGRIYILDQGTYQDNGQPILRERAFPHLVPNGVRAVYREFAADFAVGEGEVRIDDSGTQVPPMLELCWSDDRGKSFGNSVNLPIYPGAYKTQPMLRNLGMARDRVFRLRWSGNWTTALQGAWIDARPCRT